MERVRVGSRPSAQTGQASPSASHPDQSEREQAERYESARAARSWLDRAAALALRWLVDLGLAVGGLVASSGRVRVCTTVIRRRTAGSKRGRTVVRRRRASLTDDTALLGRLGRRSPRVVEPAARALAARPRLPVDQRAGFPDSLALAGHLVRTLLGRLGRGFGREPEAEHESEREQRGAENRLLCGHGGGRVHPHATAAAWPNKIGDPPVPPPAVDDPVRSTTCLPSLLSSRPVQVELLSQVASAHVELVARRSGSSELGSPPRSAARRHWSAV